MCTTGKTKHENYKSVCWQRTQFRNAKRRLFLTDGSKSQSSSNFYCLRKKPTWIKIQIATTREGMWLCSRADRRCRIRECEQTRGGNKTYSSRTRERRSISCRTRAAAQLKSRPSPCSSCLLGAGRRNGSGNGSGGWYPGFGFRVFFNPLLHWYVKPNKKSPKKKIHIIICATLQFPGWWCVSSSSWHVKMDSDKTSPWVWMKGPVTTCVWEGVWEVT